MIFWQKWVSKFWVRIEVFLAKTDPKTDKNSQKQTMYSSTTNTKDNYHHQARSDLFAGRNLSLSRMHDYIAGVARLHLWSFGLIFVFFYVNIFVECMKDCNLTYDNFPTNDMTTSNKSNLNWDPSSAFVAFKTDLVGTICPPPYWLQ